MFIGLQGVFAQKTITGTVTSVDDGNPIPGVTVVAVGVPGIGTITDLNGKYSLSVPGNVKQLQFSFVGMKTIEMEIGTNTTIDIKMATETVKLGEVVVTALGIKRETKALGYSVQEVKGEELTKVPDVSNFVNSMSGKISGVQITGASGNMGGSSRILIRGINSVTGNNQPLFVIDGTPLDNSDYNTVNTARGAGGYDYGNTIQDINPNDVENITVLKGPNAAALYGSRAANGVILITTKKGTFQKTKAIGLTYNAQVTFDKVALLPEYQNEYGGGAIMGDSVGFEVANIDGKDYLVPQYNTDESFGPKYDPNIKVLPWNAFDSWDVANYMKTKPWVKPANDVDYFFRTGVSYTHNVSMTGGNENSAFRMSFTNLNSEGYMVNSSLKRNTINFNGNTRLSKKLNAYGAVTYVQNKATGRPETGYGDNNVVMRMNQWGQRSVDYKDLESYINPDGSQRTWNRVSWDDGTPMYSDNPYWTRYKNYEDDQRDRYYGNIGFTYDIFDWLKFSTKLNTDNYTFRVKERVAIGSQAQSKYSESVRELNEINTDFLFTANKSFAHDIKMNLSFGGNRMNREYYRNANTTAGGLLVRDLYTLSNSTSPYLSDDYNSKKRINSLYGNLDLEYKGMAYLDVTLRNDWASTLPIDNCSYLYPSVTGSFVFTELQMLKNNNILSFGKIRVGWAQVGSDADPYRVANTYSNFTTTDGNPYNFGSDAIFSTNGTLNNAGLKPEITSSIEFGADLRFLKNRAGIDFTYYSKSSKNQILPVAVSAASGYGFLTVNAGEITNKGIELMVNGTPVKRENSLRWDISVNWSKNTNKVVELYQDVDIYTIANAPFVVYVGAKVGEKYGAIMGTDFVYAPNGQKVVGTDGMYLSSEIKSIGNVLPDWNAGINNTLGYKGIDFGFLIDIQQGGQYFSTTNMWGMYSGILAGSVGTNAKGKSIRDAVADGGGVLVSGVYGELNADGTVSYTDADGNPSSVPVANTTYVEGQDWAHYFYDGPAKQNVFDANYVKLREVRLGYTIPSKYTTKYIQNLKISVWGRNLAMWGLSNKSIDPEIATSSGNIQGIEGGELPSLKTYGISLNVGF